MPHKPPTVRLMPDGRWSDGDHQLSFGVHINQIERQGPVHIFHDGSASDRSRCGLASRDSSKMIVQTAFPKHHPVCRQCNYTGHFGTYGDTLTATHSI